MEQKILSTFLYNHKLKFNEIEKILKIRSNKLAYHIKKLKDKKILDKKEDFYELSKKSEPLLPYITEKRSILPVILIVLKNRGKIFLHEREKRPFKNLLSLPGGRILSGETIQKATERIMKEKFGVNCNFKKVNSVSLEQVNKNRQPIHSFLLILVTATTKDKIKYSSIKKSQTSIIKSDYELITNDLDSKVKIKNINWNLA